jgi:hypothetical protein
MQQSAVCSTPAPPATSSRPSASLTPSFATAVGEQISDATKLQIVCAWLQEVLGSRDHHHNRGHDTVPPFEINSQTVNVLFELALHNKQREVDVGLLIEDANEKAAHYKKEGTPPSLSSCLLCVHRWEFLQFI